MAKRENDLTPKQARFVEEYLIDLNATQAAIRAGYSAKTADKQGSQLLGKTGVATAIAAAQGARSERTEVTTDYVLTRLVENVERAMQSEPVKDNHGRPTGEYRYEGAVANKALELLGRHLGMFKDRAEISGTNGGALEVFVTRNIVQPNAET